MKKMKFKFVTLLMLGMLSFDGIGQNLTNPKIADFKWLAGNWEGDGFGGVSQEAWTDPTANSMVGVYKHYKDGKPTFYEILNILEIDGKISLRLKHFNPDMTGWEEKADFVEFPLVSASPTKIEFNGLSYELIAEDKMEIKLSMKRGEKRSVEVFNFIRKKI